MTVTYESSLNTLGWKKGTATKVYAEATFTPAEEYDAVSRDHFLSMTDWPSVTLNPAKLAVDESDADDLQALRDSLRSGGSSSSYDVFRKQLGL